MRPAQDLSARTPGGVRRVGKRSSAGGQVQRRTRQRHRGEHDSGVQSGVRSPGQSHLGAHLSLLFAETRRDLERERHRREVR